MALFGGEVRTIPYQSPDYSGSVAAARSQAMAGAQGIAQGIAGGISQVTDYFKQQSEKKKLIKQSDIQIDAALKLFPDLSPTLQGVRDQIKDENISLNERADIAESVAGLINMGTKQMQANAEFGLKKRQLDIEEGRGIQSALIDRAKMEAEANKLRPITDINVPGGVMQMRENPQTGVLEPIQVAGVSQGTGLVDLVKGFEGFNPNAYGDYKQTSVGYGTKGKEGEVLTEAQATDRLNTELSGHAKRIEEAAKLKGVKLNQNQFNALTSFDFNTGRGADLIERFGDKPEELVSKMQEYTKAGGEELPGLVKRRGVEAALFLTPTESTVGFKPTKPEKQETHMTAEQVQNLVVQGFKINARPLADGSFMVSGADIGGQAGETFEFSPEGGFKMTRGGGAKAEAAKKAGEEAQKQEKQSTNQMFDMAAQTIEQIPNLPDNPIGAKAAEWFGKVVPGTPAGQVAEKLGSMNANIAFGVMQDMRAASPTGAAAGTMTEKEWPLFWQKYGNLSAATNKNDLRNRLQNMTIKMFDAANGTPDERKKAIKDKKITQEQNAKVEEDYLRLRNRMKIPESGIPGFSDTQLNVTSGASSLFPADVQSIIDKYTHQPK